MTPEAIAPKQPPVMEGQHWLLGSAGKFKDHPIGLLESMASKEDPIVQFRLAIFKCYFVSSVSGTEYILRGNMKNYTKGGPFFASARSVFNQNVGIANGEYWAQQRRIMNPMFHKKVIDSFYDIIGGIVQKTLAKWQAHAQSSQEAYNVHDDNMRSVNDMITKLVFEAGLSPEEQGEMLDAMNFMLDETQRRIQNGLIPPKWWPGKNNRQLRTAQDTFYRLALKVINFRKTQEPGHNLLDMMLAATDSETGLQMTLEQIINEVKIFFVAGTETAANATTWCMHWLAKYPEIEARVREEIDQVVGHGPLTMENAPKLTYLTQCLNETMRLCPPAWMLSRSIEADDVIDGYQVKKGTSIFISPYMLHMNPAVWDEPQAFRPERFAKENLTADQRKAHIPFGNGQRRCIGEHLAWVMMWSMMVQYLRHFKWRNNPQRPAELLFSASIQPKDGLWLNLEPLGNAVEEASVATSEA